MNASSEQSNVIGRLLSLAEVAQLLGVSRATVYRMKDEGQIRYYKIRGVFRIRESDVVRFLNDSTFEVFENVYEYGTKDKKQVAR